MSQTNKQRNILRLQRSPKIDTLIQLSFRYVPPGGHVQWDEPPIDGRLLESYTQPDGRLSSTSPLVVVSDCTLLSGAAGPEERSGFECDIDYVGLIDALHSVRDLNFEAYAKSLVSAEKPEATVTLAIEYRDSGPDHNGEYDSDVRLVGLFDFQSGEIIPVENVCDL